MAGTQELLTAINNMQANTQAALPVIPNNGNPGGAYNAPPSAPAIAQPPVAPMANNNYDWLKPSPYMQMVNDMLKQRPQFTGATQPALQPPAVTQAPATVPNATPVMPQRAI